MFEPEFPAELKKRIASLESELSLYRTFLRTSHERELVFKQNSEYYQLLLIAAQKEIKHLRESIQEYSI